MTTIALAGNPNSGKTTLFNELTGARQHVGNYPGVTVELKEGTFSHRGTPIHVVDLPGIYSITAYSLEEIVTRNYLVREKPEVVIDIIDASNIERHLYLMIQLLEMGVPLCGAMNMMDVASNRGITIHPERLSELLGIPIMPTVARTGKGVEELLDAALSVKDNPPPQPLRLNYGQDIDRALDRMEDRIKGHAMLEDRYDPRWFSLKYLEQDEQIKEYCAKQAPEVAKAFDEAYQQLLRHLESTLNTYPEALIADQRYGYIKSLVSHGIVNYATNQSKLYISDKIDLVLTNRFLGPLFMVVILMLLYKVTFTYSEIPVGWFESFFGWMGSTAEKFLPEGPLRSMIVSGVIDGMGGVMGFVPLILFMFFGISFLEDSGYLARMAFMLDRVFRVFGLHGSSVMPFIISGGIAGGCAVPGVMASRTIKSRKERLATILTVPIMNCGAKLPIFAILVGTFFSQARGEMLLIITFISWIGALGTAKFLRMTVIRGETTPFVMELPPYRIPTLKGLFIHTWERTWQYIKKAGTVILGISILVWAMMTYPLLSPEKEALFETERQEILATYALPDSSRALNYEIPTKELTPEEEKLRKDLFALEGLRAETALENSVAGRIGKGIEKITRWAGFDWRTNIALVGGVAAKEVIVSTLGTAYSLGETDPEAPDSLSKVLKRSKEWSPLKASSVILFVIFYAPCFVTLVCIAKEAGSWKWALFALLFNTFLAFLLSLGVFQLGTLLNLGI
ncbi:MAG TPA: ferrous iron transport protein B [Synergistaceae bacterium]|nr:ferrous iron transport protein B [Synergistaceae bacterium]